VWHIFLVAAEVAKARVVRTARVEPCMGDELAMVRQLEEGAAARGGKVLPDRSGKDIIRQVRESHGVPDGSGEAYTG